MDVLHRLLDRADALVSNLAPGSTARIGLSRPRISPRGTRNVIPVEIDGYGPGGPISHKRAYDLLIQAESGSCAVTGYPGMPAKPGPPMADFTTGLYAALSILALLFSQDRRDGGPAPAVAVSLFDTADRHHGLPADLHPALRHRPAAARHEFTRGGAVRRLPDRATGRPWCSAPPTTGNGSGSRGRSSRATTWPTTRASPPTPAGASTASCSTRPSLRGVPNTISQHMQKVADAAGIGNSRYNLPSEVRRASAADRA